MLLITCSLLKRSFHLASGTPVPTVSPCLYLDISSPSPVMVPLHLFDSHILGILQSSFLRHHSFSLYNYPMSRLYTPPINLQIQDIALI